MTAKFKKFFLALVTVVLGAMSSGAMAVIPTYTATVNSTSYDFTYITGSFTDNSVLLQSQPWWGSESSATTFTTAVGGNLGSPNTEAGAWGPYFAFELRPDSMDGDSQLASFYRSATGLSDCCANPWAEESKSYAIATISSTAAPEIDGALIPQIGFLIGGLYVMFGRRRETSICEQHRVS